MKIIQFWLFQTSKNVELPYEYRACFPMTWGYLQQNKGINRNMYTLCRVGLLPKSHCLCRTSQGTLDGAILVRVLEDEQCKHHSAIRVATNLPFSSDHRRIGEAKNPGPKGSDHVEITIGV